MEEKKTMKMTKAEAFEYLKGKKVNCYDGTNNLYCKLVKKMWDCGCEYKGFMCPPTYSVSALAVDRKGGIGHVPTEVFDRYINLPFEEISAEDILSIEIVDDEKKSKEEDELDEINLLGSQICEILRHMKGHHHVAITETDVILYDEGMCLFHSDPF